MFLRAGITLLVPGREEKAYIHNIYMSELVRGIILPETSGRLLAIIERLKEQEAIEGVILGGTELPLILRGGKDEVVPFLDTTKLHVEQIVARILS